MSCDSFARSGPVSEDLLRYVLLLCVSRCDTRPRFLLTILADGIAAGATLSLLNYFLLGFAVDVDGWYFHSFEIWLACIFVFPISGNVAFSLLEYRLGHRSLLGALVENFTWALFLCVPTRLVCRDSILIHRTSALSSSVVYPFISPRQFLPTFSRATSPGVRPRRKSSVPTSGWKSQRSSSASGSRS